MLRKKIPGFILGTSLFVLYANYYSEVALVAIQVKRGILRGGLLHFL